MEQTQVRDAEYALESYKKHYRDHIQFHHSSTTGGHGQPYNSGCAARSARATPRARPPPAILTLSASVCFPRPIKVSPINFSLVADLLIKHAVPSEVSKSRRQQRSKNEIRQIHNRNAVSRPEPAYL